MGKYKERIIRLTKDLIIKESNIKRKIGLLDYDEKEDVWVIKVNKNLTKKEKYDIVIHELVHYIIMKTKENEEKLAKKVEKLIKKINLRYYE